MGVSILINILRFFLLVFIQVFFLKNTAFYNLTTPHLYILFILLLPFETPNFILFTLAFILGITIDVFFTNASVASGPIYFLGTCFFTGLTLFPVSINFFNALICSLLILSSNKDVVITKSFISRSSRREMRYKLYSVGCFLLFTHWEIVVSVNSVLFASQRLDFLSSLRTIAILFNTIGSACFIFRDLAILSDRVIIVKLTQNDLLESVRN